MVTTSPDSLPLLYSLPPSLSFLQFLNRTLSFPSVVPRLILSPLLWTPSLSSYPSLLANFYFIIQVLADTSLPLTIIPVATTHLPPKTKFAFSGFPVMKLLQHPLFPSAPSYSILVITSLYSPSLTVSYVRARTWSLLSLST